MADSTKDKSAADSREGAGVAAISENAALEHTEGGQTTRADTMDAGVPMVQGQPDEPIGPEDAFGPGPKRGDYSQRVDSGPHMVTEEIPLEERQKLAGDGDLGDVPRFRLVPAGTEAGNVGDSPGKGGVSTSEALEARR